MPRDGSGVYTLPAGNPVVTNTVIASVWANSTMSDIAAQLNNVLTRDGLLGPTAPFKIQDGTVPAPGLAFNSEPGLGWYRPGAGRIGVAALGAQVGMVDASAAVTTAYSLWPRAAGTAAIGLWNQAASAANANAMTIQTTPTGYNLTEVLLGTATAKPLTLTFPGGLLVNGANMTMDIGGFITNYIQVNKPDATGESSIAFFNKALGTTIGRWLCGANTGDLAYQNFNDAGVLIGQPILVRRATGIVEFAGQRVLCQQVGLGGGFNISDIGGSFSCLQPQGGSNSSWAILWNKVNGTYTFNESTGVANCTIHPDGGLSIRGNAFKPGGGAWVDNSDERIKDNIVPYTTGLDAVVQLAPVSYGFKAETQRDTSKRYIRVIAQQAKVAAPELVTIGPGDCGDIHLEDMHQLDEGPVLWMLVNAVKTLNTRLTALEVK